PALITVWAKKAGLRLRRRGRQRTSEPSPRTKAILETAQTLTLAATGWRFGISRQAVWRMVNRWCRSDKSGSPEGQSVLPPAPTVSTSSLCPLTDGDLTGDIERIIMKTVTPYVDPSNPMLNLDELQAECRAKLAKIIDGGRLALCPT